jgi:hypothetical protein
MANLLPIHPHIKEYLIDATAGAPMVEPASTPAPTKTSAPVKARSRK